MIINPVFAFMKNISKAGKLEKLSIFQCLFNKKWKWKWSRSVVSDSLRPHGLYVAYQTPPSMGFSRQEYWSGVPFPSLGDLPDPGIEPGSPEFQADALTSEPPGKPYRRLTADQFSKNFQMWDQTFLFYTRCRDNFDVWYNILLLYIKINIALRSGVRLNIGEN